MALSFHPTNAPLFHHLVADPDMSFLQDDVHPEVTDALLGFVYDPLDTAGGIDDFLSPLPDAVDVDADADGQRCAKRARNNCDADHDALLDFKAGDVCPDQAWDVGRARADQQAPALPEFLTEFVLPLPPPPPPPMPPSFVKGADAKGNGLQSVQSAAARERRKRISEKTAELSRLIPGGHRLNTAEMLQEAGRHVKLLQAQIGMLALMHSIEEKIPPMAQEQMHALLVCGGVQERLAAEGKCLVPRKLLDTIAKDDVVKSNALVNRDLTRSMDSLPKQ